MAESTKSRFKLVRNEYAEVYEMSVALRNGKMLAAING